MQESTQPYLTWFPCRDEGSALVSEQKCLLGILSDGLVTYLKENVVAGSLNHMSDVANFSDSLGSISELHYFHIIP